MRASQAAIRWRRNGDVYLCLPKGVLQKSKKEKATFAGGFPVSRILLRYY
jgi:hypothetical protein